MYIYKLLVKNIMLLLRISDISHSYNKLKQKDIHHISTFDVNVILHVTIYVHISID